MQVIKCQIKDIKIGLDGKMKKFIRRRKNKHAMGADCDKIYEYKFVGGTLLRRRQVCTF